ncbi:hypothetical protein RsS62_00380 [Rhizobium dioscoreae]|uniref:Uncharacterized protein n=1 Tax=Rhizobium dioscoreae TaxID=2653122 RepID=A0ABQ0Z5U1_9HYPH|nr:hypothetical protein RsS62_00380 [Rhizobium dioscoreae]GES50913.1 hypothetical protein RsS93_35270 [Rhizobium dioscoreae]GLU82364.1 hypothetical protein Rhsp01_35400 [Rhizobium sp. NBRC 114257]
MFPALVAIHREEATEEIEIFRNAQRRIEIAAETLGHIGNAGTSETALMRVGHIAVEDVDVPLLRPCHPGSEREQRRLSNAVRANDACHAARRNNEIDPVECHFLPIAMRNAGEADNFARHWGNFTASCGGHAAAGSVRT